MKCLLCGKELPENAKFCDACGARVIPQQNSGGNNFNGVNVDNSFESINSIDDNNLNSINGNDNLNSTNGNDNLNSINNMSVPVNNSNNDEHNNKNESVKKKHNKIPFIIIAVVLLLAALVSVAFLFLNKDKSAKTVFISGFKKVSNGLFSNKKYSSFNSSLKFNVESNDASLKEISPILNNLSFDVNFNVDSTKKMLKGDINLDYKNQSAVSMGIYGVDNVIYLSLGNLYDKLIKVPMDSSEYNKLYQTSSSDINNIKDGLNNAFANSLSDKYLKKIKENIKINGTSTKVTANKLVLDGTTLKEFIMSFTKELRNDNKFITSLSNLYGISKDQIKSALMVNSKTSFSKDCLVEFTIYTNDNSNSFVGLALDISYDGAKDSISILKSSKNNYVTSITSGSVTINGSINISKSNNGEKIEFSIKYGKNTIGFILDNKYSNNTGIQSIDTNNAISYLEFEKSASTEIQNNILKNETLVKLIQDLSLIGSDTTSIKDNNSSSSYSDFLY